MFIFHKKLRDIPLSEKLDTFYHALRLDLSMTAYIAVIPILAFLFFYLSKKNQANFKWVSIYNKVLIVLFSLISIINFNIYREWGSKINVKAISLAFDTPNEALASSASSPIIFSLFIFIVILLTGLYLNFLLVKSKISFAKTPIVLKIVISILLIGINFLLIRGGWGTSPNTQSMAYFSENQLLNHTSLNTEWNLVSSVLASTKTNHNPYVYKDFKIAKQDITNLYQVKKDTTINILKTQKPNIVLFILESFTADVTKTLGNEDGITPNFDSLIRKGVLFSNIYAAGNRTDKGIIATLAGFPTLGTGSVVKWPEKMQKIPAISQKLYEQNYQTSFFYGGESEFDNYKAFILSHNFQKLIDKNSFEKKDMNSKWGAHDDLVFKSQLKEANTTKQPFFSTILSLSNHEPFELPVKLKFGNKSNVEKFKSTAYYTDSCIMAYLNEAKKQHWYSNTLFIFIADHGHSLPKLNHEVYEAERFHIPLLFYGDVIKDEYKGKTYNHTGSQQDLAATLLAQLNINAKEFIWSRNLLNPYGKNFAFFTWDNGFGFRKDDHFLSFDNVGKNILSNSNPKQVAQTQENIELGKSYLQTAYQQFINL